MNSTWSRPAGIVFLVVLWFLSPSIASAQCGVDSRQFATISSKAYDQVRVDAWGAENSGLEIGRFWQSSNSSLGNNFAGGCPSQGASQNGGGWWQLNQAPLRGLRGFVSGAGCAANSCPDGDLTVLVEERGASFWPGRAYFMALRVDPTPGALRYWDFSRVDPSPSPSMLALERFPTPIITAIMDWGHVFVTIRDIAHNVHSANGANNTPLPTSTVLKSYDLYRFNGNQDPGRQVASWTLIQQIPYQSGDLTGVNVYGLCPTFQGSVFLALGLTFRGGTGPDVKSRYVGSSTQLSCSEWQWAARPAGAVPDGRFVPGTPLRIAKDTSRGGLDLELSTGSPCHSFDEGLEVYEGTLGDFSSHRPVACGPSSFSTGSPGISTITPTAGSTYYLVVPFSRQLILTPEGEYAYVPSREGSYGRRSNGQERGPGLSQCLAQWVEDCP